MRNPFDWDYLTSVPISDEIFGPFSIAFLVVFVAGLVFTLLAPGYAASKLPNHRLHQETVRKISGRATWGWITGLFFFLCRFMGLQFLGWRLWLYVSVVAAVGVGLYTFWWLRTKYPPRVEAYRKEQRRRAYRPGSAAALALASNPRAAAREGRVERPPRPAPKE